MTPLRTRSTGAGEPSALMALNTVLMYGGIENFEFTVKWLLNSPVGFAVQALIDAVLIVALCLVADAVLTRASMRPDDRTLLSMFARKL